MTKRARVLASGDETRLLRHVIDHRNPRRDEVIILLSFKAGLRACEIAGLDWQMVLDPTGKVSDHIAVAGHIAKYGSARRIPLNPNLKVAIRKLHHESGKPYAGPVVRSERGNHMRPRSIVNWFRTVYDEAGLRGCSSHSGRRTFITRAARLLPSAGGSLRDVQELAGHRSLTTTEGYIEGDRDAQRKLVRLI